MKASAIGWTDYSGGDLNFVTGCTPVSEGCQHCYARAIARRFGRDFDTVVCDEEKLLRAARRDYGHSPKRGLGRKPMCFVCDTGDLFHEDVPIHFLQLAWQSMAYRDDVIWQVLTKRPERALDFFNAYGYQYQLGGEPHIWLGVTAENQRTADERIPILLDIPAAVRFVSVEPMLGPVDLDCYLGYNTQMEAKQNEQRGCALRDGGAGRVGDRRCWAHLENEKWLSCKGGTPHPAGLSPSAQDGEWDTPTRGSPSVSMETLQWPDSSGDDHQSPKWHQGRQPPRESRASDVFRESETCVSHRPQNTMGAEQSGSKAEQQGHGGDSGSICCGGNNTSTIGESFWRDVSDNFGHSSWEKAPEAERRDSRLLGEANASKCQERQQRKIHLVICGAESGPNRRPFEAAWAEALYQQCKKAGTPFFAKQDSAHRPGAPLVLSDGIVQQWPEG